jgi:mono/diheme cytochrome c family protein
MKTVWRNASAAKRSLMIAGMALAALLLGFITLIALELLSYRALDTRDAPAQNAQKSGAMDLVKQGEYLATLGNCAACHTARGGAAYAGGKAIHTPFGAVFASNITPDAEHGIGRWSADAFYRALHLGVNAQGKLLTPAFPYPNTTHVSRTDSDALYAYFMQGVQPAAQKSKAHELAFPFNTQFALAVWRVLFFEKGSENAIDSIAPHAHSTESNGLKPIKSEIERGRYIVQGLAHCSACHAQRNAFGAASSDGLLSGALMPMQDWYAPSLHAKEEAGAQHWPRERVVALLKTGVTHNASVLGPMAEVVAKSTQYWSDEDLNATAAYLQSLPVQSPPQDEGRKPSTSSASPSAQPQYLRQGAALYSQHCATCHGEDGKGVQEAEIAQSPASTPAQRLIPSLAANRAVSLSSSANLVRIILAGGFAPATPGNPSPYGMPPFVHVLTDEEIAAVATYIRASWGNQAPPVSASQVITQRRGVLQ